MSFAHLKHECGGLSESVVVEQSVQRHVVHIFLVESDEFFFEELFAEVNEVAVFSFEVVAQSCLGFGGGDPTEPLFLRVLVGGGEYLHLVSALEFVAERL